MKISGFVLFLVFFVFLKYAFCEEKSGYPHFSREGCNTCHVSHGGKQLIKDPITLCKECHPLSEGQHHKVDVKTKLNKASLPLDAEGKMVCITCHNMHPKKGSPFENNLLRTDPDSLCLSCHDK